VPILATLRANLLACVLGLAAAIFLIIAIIQTIQLNGFLWIDGANDKVERLTIDNNELRAELKSISDRKNEQKAETGKRIEQAERGNEQADKRAERIEKAPLPGGCVTPPEIMGADL
jgi:hypothetical protein